eukprot:GILK01008388.1.p1 GENE.GILK01008388.1~~GILK01008388.1.p1  ORF type:complete len:182 (-),score=20.73 GILK01008388.1:178-723(-)
MILNGTVRLEGEHVVLVPYLRSMVETYHAWMQDPWIREMTASEPLTFEEEVENQESWYKDDTKLTFIILDKSLPENVSLGELAHGGGMCGDVNLYLNDYEDNTAGEIEVMIAEPASRRKGLASQALDLMMKYANKNLAIKTFRAKIKAENDPSIRMFQKLGYVQESYSEVFGEVTYVHTIG